MAHTPVVHLAVDRETAGLYPPDLILRDAFAALDVEARPLLWSDPVPPGAAVLVRSTWDYVEHPVAFRAWLDELERTGARVWNSVGLMRWNLHKGYLLELEAAGVEIVPTAVVRQGEDADLGALARARGWTDPVVKPAVSAGARLTVHAGRVGADVAADHLVQVAAAEDVLVQPFLPEIATHGELSLVVIAGEPLSVVRKRARAGDWRVQSLFGGTAEREPVSDDLRTLAASVLAALPEVPTYARIDLVEHRGVPLLMEVELIEPELWFDHHPHVADALAAAVTASLAADDVPPQVLRP